MVEDVCILCSLKIGEIYELVKVCFWGNTDLLRQDLVSLSGRRDRHVLSRCRGIRQDSLLLSFRFTLDLCDLLG